MPRHPFRTPARQSRHAFRVARVPAVLALATVPWATPSEGQVATVRVEENFRAEPNGTIVARVLPGTELPVARVRGNWVETELEGWVWARSLRSTGRRGLDLIVTPAGGENLRSEPQGTVRARLVGGGLLDELGRRPGWVRVRRVGWIWLESVSVGEAGASGSSGLGGEAGQDEGLPSGEETPSRAGPEGEPTEPGASPSAHAAVPPPSSPPGPGVLTVPEPGLPILSTPDGDTLAQAEPGRDVAVMARRGAWARVRVEGWVWVGTEPGAAYDSTSAPVDPEAVIREPDRYRGRLVTWSLQFLSLEAAERVRTDFWEGEPFLLTRPAGSVGTFVYIAVSPERLGDLEDLTPLESIEVVGRIRTGASGLTGSPILDLVELRRRERP